MTLRIESAVGRLRVVTSKIVDINTEPKEVVMNRRLNQLRDLEEESMRIFDERNRLISKRVANMLKNGIGEEDDRLKHLIDGTIEKSSVNALVSLCAKNMGLEANRCITFLGRLKFQLSPKIYRFPN